MTAVAETPAKSVIFDQIAAERKDLLDLLRQLRPEEWNAQSLCSEWRVRDVVAHLLGNQNDLRYMLLGGPSKGGKRSLADRKDLATQTLVEEFASTITAKPNLFTNFFPSHMLLDTWVHQRDIRWALGPDRQSSQDPARIQSLLGYFANKIAKKGSNGVRYVATDVNWQAGDGLEVKGPAEALIMALGKRPAALSRLEGPGLSLLTEQLKDK